MPRPHATRASSTILLAVLLVASAAGCQTGPRPAAEFVQQAQLLHDGSLRAAVVRDRDLDEYLADLGKRIVAAATALDPANTRDPTLAALQFHLVGSDVVNAYGTGGRHVYVYNGLLQRCGSEEELAALMAVQYAHALRLDIQQTGLRPDPRAGTDDLSLSRVAFAYVGVPFSAAQCLDADRRAFDVYVRAGWDPARFAEAYERLRDVHRLDLPPSIGGDGQPRARLSARAAAARQFRGALPAGARDWRQPTVADADGFKEVKAIARRSGGGAAAVPPDAAGRLDPAGRALLYLAAFPNVVLPADQQEQQRAQGQLQRDVTPPAPPPPRIEPS